MRPSALASRRAPGPVRAARGQALVEYLFVIGLLLTTGFVLIQYCLVSLALTDLNLATAFAARSYATNQDPKLALDVANTVGGKTALLGNFVASDLVFSGSTAFGGVSTLVVTKKFPIFARGIAFLGRTRGVLGVDKDGKALLQSSAVIVVE